MTQSGHPREVIPDCSQDTGGSICQQLIPGASRLGGYRDD